MAKLITISQEELNKIIENHQHYLHADCDGWETMRADLRSLDLSYMDLSHADLRYANLYHAYLSHANLSYTRLSYTNLAFADLYYADLTDADLSHTDLFHAFLSHAILSHADLSHTNLSYAYLDHADLSYANLSHTDLTHTHLSYANLFNTDLTDVHYDETTTFFALQCPEKGSFIGYKKSGDKIVELRIEEDSKRSSATTRKCRASKVTVLSITSLDGKEEFTICENTGKYEFTYEVGKTYEIEDFDENRWHECGKGIHFFLTRQEAVKY